MSDFQEGRLVRFAHQKDGGPVHRVSKRVTNSLGEFVELEDMVGQFAVHLFVSAEPEAPAAHRWSGWPGAWCLDCGIEDPIEQALADGNYVEVPDPSTEMGFRFDFPNVTVPPCPCPGEGRFDPYRKP